MKHQPISTDDLRERFILFLASKPADQSYNWRDRDHCACGTFIHERLGIPMQVRRWYAPWLDKTVMQRNLMEESQVWRRWNTLASVEPHTYGALLQRVRDI
jgi:hypothetical protein